MKILLMTDIEGVTNLDDYEMVRTNSGDGYIKACHELMEDVNAAIRGFYDAGVETVYVYDGHHKGTNFIKEMLDSRAIQLYWDNWHEYVTSGQIDAYAEVGLHAMAGAENAFLEHTQNSKEWFDYKINGVSCGEFIQGAAYVGKYDIPFIFVSGDGAACKEAESFVEGIETAVVKNAASRNTAISLPTEVARQRIYEGAKKSVALIDKIKPYKVSLPAVVEVTFQRTDYCDEAAKKYERIGSRTVRKFVPDIVDYMSLLL